MRDLSLDRETRVCQQRRFPKRPAAARVVKEEDTMDAGGVCGGRGGGRLLRL